MGDFLFNVFMNGTGLGDVLGGLTAVIAIPMIIYNMAICLFGYKLFKIQLMIMGFVIGSVLGAVIGSFGGSAIAILVGLVLGILGAWLAEKLYKVSVFVTMSISTTIIFIFLIGFLGGGFSATTVIISVILGIAVGVIGVIFNKVTIILYTAISGGLFTGIGLALAIGTPIIGIVIGIPLATLGIWLQHRLEKKDGSLNVTSSKEKQMTKGQNSSFGEMAKSITDSARDITDFVVEKVARKESRNSNQDILSSISGNYWTSGMPMLVTETQIINQAGDDSSVFLNIGIQNLSEHPIVGFYFDIDCYDLLKNKLESISNAVYLDLHIEQGKSWFNTKPIHLPDKTTRKCIITIKNVVLENEDIWQNEINSPLRELPKVESLTLAPDLMEEYYTEIEEKLKVRNAKGLYRFAPKHEQDFWYCSCGQVNTSEQCVLCALEKDFLFTIFDTSRLQIESKNRIDEKLRLEEERRQRIAEQTEVVKQKSMEIAGQAKQTSIKMAEKARNISIDIIRKIKFFALSILDKVKQHKKQAIVIGSTSCAVLVALVVGLSVYNSDTNRFLRAMKHEEYFVATQIYKEAADTELEKINSIIIEKAEFIETEFKEERIDLNTSTSALNLLIESTGFLLSPLTQTQMRIEDLHNSRMAFQQGQQEITEKNYQGAINCFAEVIMEDGNYAQAQIELKKATEVYKSDLLKTVEELLAQKQFDEAATLVYMGAEFLGEDTAINAALKEVESKIVYRQQQEERNRPLQAMKDMVLAEVAKSTPLLSQTPRIAVIGSGSENELVDARLLELDKNDFYGLLISSYGSNDNHIPAPAYSTSFIDIYIWLDGKLSSVWSDYYSATHYYHDTLISHDKNGNLVLWRQYTSPFLIVAHEDIYYQFDRNGTMSSINFGYYNGTHSIDGFDVSQEEWEERRKEYSDLEWTQIVSREENYNGDVVHVNTKQSVEDTLGKLNQLMQIE